MTPLPKLLRTYQGIIIPVLMILIAVLGTVFGIVPIVGKIIQIRTDSVALSSSVLELQSKMTVLNNEDEQTYKDQLRQLILAVPSDKSLTTLFTTIDALGAQSGVTVVEVSLTKPGSIATQSAQKQTNEERQIGSSLLPFSVTIAGNYDQIHNFLAQVVSVRRFFRVRDFDISFLDPSNITVHLGMDAFYSPISLTIGPVDSPIEPLTAKENQIIATVEKMPVLGIATQSDSSMPPVLNTSRTDPFSPQ